MQLLLVQLVMCVAVADVMVLQGSAVEAVQRSREAVQRSELLSAMAQPAGAWGDQ
jgi:hypothetical protein